MNKLKWWYKLAALPSNRYPKKLFIRNGIFKKEKAGRESAGSSLMVSFHH